jgi:hypothetical protein
MDFGLHFRGSLLRAMTLGFGGIGKMRRARFALLLSASVLNPISVSRNRAAQVHFRSHSVLTKIAGFFVIRSEKYILGDSPRWTI